MSILDIFRSKPTGLVCPRCERSMEGHDEAACSRRMSRRFFFQSVGGAAAAVAVASVLPPAPILAAGREVMSVRMLQDYDILRQEYVTRLDVCYGHAPLEMVHGVQCSVSTAPDLVIPKEWNVPPEALRLIDPNEVRAGAHKVVTFRTPRYALFDKGEMVALAG